MIAIEAIRTLEASNMPREQSKTNTRVFESSGRADLVTKADLEVRLWRQTAAIVGMVGFLIVFFRYV